MVSFEKLSDFTLNIALESEKFSGKEQKLVSRNLSESFTL